MTIDRDLEIAIVEVAEALYDKQVRGIEWAQFRGEDLMEKLFAAVKRRRLLTPRVMDSRGNGPKVPDGWLDCDWKLKTPDSGE